MYSFRNTLYGCPGVATGLAALLGKKLVCLELAVVKMITKLIQITPTLRISNIMS